MDSLFAPCAACLACQAARASIPSCISSERQQRSFPPSIPCSKRKLNSAWSGWQCSSLNTFQKIGFSLCALPSLPGLAGSPCVNSFLYKRLLGVIVDQFYVLGSILKVIDEFHIVHKTDPHQNLYHLVDQFYVLGSILKVIDEFYMVHKTYPHQNLYHLMGSWLMKQRLRILGGAKTVKWQIKKEN